MRIPEIQERMRELSEELAYLAGELSRRTSDSRASRHSTPMTEELREKIIEAYEANPQLPLARIAAAFNVNPGRVSETLRGFRE